MHQFSPSSIDESNSIGMSLTNSEMLPNAFSSNLVGGRKVNRRKMRKIYKSYKKKHSSRGRTIKQQLRSLKEGVLTKLFNRSKKHGHKHGRSRRHRSRRHYQKGGNYDPAFLSRALASNNAELNGLFTSCQV
jgi:hypothetical protein